MAEYIEREALIEKCKAIIQDKWNDKVAPISWSHAYADFIEDIENQPAADVAPVVHGKWYMRGGRACCSNCNVKSLWGSDWDGCKNHEREFVSAKSNYCPNCGAKMDGEEHENNV